MGVVFFCHIVMLADCHYGSDPDVPAGWWLLCAQHPGVDQLDPLPVIPVLGIQPHDQVTVQVSVPYCS